MEHKLETEGGLLLLLQAVPLAAEQAVTPEQLETTRSNLQTRLADVGAEHARVSVEGEDHIRIEVPGDGSLDDLRALMAEHAQLEIVDGSDEAPTLGSYLVTDQGGPQREVAASVQDGKAWHTALTNEDIDPKGVRFAPSPTISPDVHIAFTAEGAKKLAQFTKANVGNYVPILLDKQVVSAPRLVEPLRGGQAGITTTNPTEALRIFAQLKYGPLPVHLREVEARVVTGDQ